MVYKKICFRRLLVPTYKAAKCKNLVIRRANIKWNALCGEIILDSEMGYNAFIDKLVFNKNERIA